VFYKGLFDFKTELSQQSHFQTDLTNGFDASEIVETILYKQNVFDRNGNF
jgi:hypothetical protein